MYLCIFRSTCNSQLQIYDVRQTRPIFWKFTSIKITHLQWINSVKSTVLSSPNSVIRLTAIRLFIEVILEKPECCLRGKTLLIQISNYIYDQRTIKTKVIWINVAEECTQESNIYRFLVVVGYDCWKKFSVFPYHAHPFKNFNSLCFVLMFLVLKVEQPHY